MQIRTLFTFIFQVLLLSGVASNVSAQTTNLAPEYYKHIQIPTYGNIGDYTENLLLLHEIYEGQLIHANYAIGTITAFRGHAGAWNRLHVAEVNTTSAYNNVSGSVISTFNNAGAWVMKTCRFNGKKYLALQVPYQAAMLEVYRFAGWSTSTAEAMLLVPFSVHGQPVNQDVLSEIQDFVPDQAVVMDYAKIVLQGNVGIGTNAPQEKLSVNGKIRAKEVKVEAENWPDYVFKPDYQAMTLPEISKYIKANGHLPEVPSAAQAEKEGIALGEMNKLLLRKIEELTLFLIEQHQKIQGQDLLINKLLEKDQRKKP